MVRTYEKKKQVNILHLFTHKIFLFLHRTIYIIHMDNHKNMMSVPVWRNAAGSVRNISFIVLPTLFVANEFLYEFLLIFSLYQQFRRWLYVHMVFLPSKTKGDPIYFLIVEPFLVFVKRN